MHCGDLNKYLIVNLEKILKQKFKTDQYTPVKYLFYNRKQGMSRYIKNYDMFLRALRLIHPLHKWEIAEHFSNLTAQASYFAQTKIFIAIHGSILSNMLFMHPKTGIIEIQFDQWLISFILLAGYTNKIHVIGRDMQISWRNAKPNNINVKNTMQLVERLLQEMFN